ncbi:MAG: DUF169 domain-containing protein [Candidatus Bathyarchaeia archaeon]|jgi:uncharacterized protein (DUF169 family)
MSKFGEEVKKIVAVVGLNWTPIAGKFSVENKGSGDSALKLSICEALDLVKRDNVILCLSKENCVCSGGRHFAGLEIVPLETIAPALTTKKHRIYDSTDTALASIRKQPQPVKRGDFFILGPLDKFDSDPDLVFLLVNPAQADMVLGLISFKGAEPFMYYPASSICSTITNVLAKASPEINLISTFERRAGSWSPNELVLAMPLKYFEEAVENIPNSGYGTSEPQPRKLPSNSKK